MLFVQDSATFMPLRVTCRGYAAMLENVLAKPSLNIGPLCGLDLGVRDRGELEKVTEQTAVRFARDTASKISGRLAAPTSSTSTTS